MSWLSRVWAAATTGENSRPNNADDYWYGPMGQLSGSGQKVTPETAIQFATVYACVRVISETLASLPLPIYRRLPNGRGKERAPDHPLATLFRERPNRLQTAFQWREMFMSHLALRGNSYNVLDPGARGTVGSITPLHPSRVMVLQDPTTTRLTYHYHPPRGDRVIYVEEEILHFRGVSDDGRVGQSPLDMQRETIGAALGAADYSSRFWKNDARPGMIFTHPNRLSDLAHERLKKDIRDEWSGRMRHSPAILEEGMTVKAVGLGNKEAQFLETRKMNRTEIAAIWRVPPHMIGDLDRATFSNIEHQAISFVRHTMVPWGVRIEQEINGHPALLGGQREFFVEFNFDGLMRGDFASRTSGYASAIMAGWMTRNEVRSIENLNPIEGGDELLTPLNMQTTNERGDDRPPPPPRDEADESELQAGAKKLEVVGG